MILVINAIELLIICGTIYIRTKDILAISVLIACNYISIFTQEDIMWLFIIVVMIEFYRCLKPINTRRNKNDSRY